ncbi:MAG: PAS domain-containing protein [Coxiellaceae bacterium]|jgi:PAS domain S-box-containing protein|nr:PAS domain-containing protein [Coxiellaceae bacterium]
MNSDVNEYFHNIIDSIEERVTWKDKNGVFLGCNRYAATLLGFKDPKDVIGKTSYDLFPKTGADLLQKQDKIVLETGHKVIFKERIVTSSGETQIHSCSKSPLRDKTGKIIGVVGNSFDITNRIKIEQLKLEKLQTEKETSEKVSRIIELIAGNIAHEIRTPLSIISINIDRLLMELKKTLLNYSNVEQKTKIKNFASNIKYTVQNSSNIITMLLIKLHSIFDAKHANIELKPNSIKQCINQAINEYPFYKKENKLITWSNQKNQDFIYLGDGLLTKHILFNLIKNSLGAIKEVGHGEISINLTSDEQFNYLIFEDTATGIPAENLDTLFQQFDIKNKRGTGLGLAFCKTIMQSYGGDITCDSEQDKFTRFTLGFPKIIDVENKT